MFFNASLVYGLAAWVSATSALVTSRQINGSAASLTDLKLRRDSGPSLPEDWPEKADKGAKYYREWMQKTGPDTPDDPPLTSVMTVVWDPYPPEVPSDLKGILYGLGKDIRTKEYIHVAAYWPKIDDNEPSPASNVVVERANPVSNASAMPQIVDALTNDAMFEDVVSASQGVFIAAWNDKGKKLPPEWPVSQVFWYMWIRAVREQYLLDHPGTEPEEGQLDYSGLSYIFRLHISNQMSKDFIAYALAIHDVKVGETWTFYPDDPYSPDLDNPFWALLGSPNGNGIIHLLTDHKVAMRGKGIRQLTVLWDPKPIHGGPSYIMWADLEFPTPCT